MNYKFAKVNGAEIHYDDQGEGTAVLFIHAGIAHLGMWDEQVKAFKEKHRVIRLDLRGWGKTAPSTEDFCDYEDVRGLLDYLGIVKAALVGCSFGGKTAVDFAVAYPERVSALVLVCSALGGYQYPELDEDPALDLLIAADKAMKEGDFAAAAEMETHLWFDGLNRQPDEVDTEIRTRAYALVHETLQIPDNEGDRIELEPRAIEQLDKITAPTLIMLGGEDLPDLITVADVFEDGIGLTQRITIDGTAHLPNMEQTDQFNWYVGDFLEKAAWQAAIDGVVVHETEAKVWLAQTEAGYRLPQMQRFGGFWTNDVEGVERPFQRLLGDGAIPLYRVHYEEDEAAKTSHSVYVVESGGSVVGNGRWASADELDLLDDADQRALAATSLEQLNAAKRPAERAQWMQRGWRKAAYAWIEAQLAARGEALVQSIKLVRNWSLSCVLEAKTAVNTYYFKTVADLPLFVNEAAFVRYLAGLFPKQVPNPVAIDHERGWMLLADLGEMVTWFAPQETRKGYLVEFARLQKTAVADVHNILEAGCIDRRLAQLPQQLEAMLTSSAVLGTVNEDEQEKVKALIPMLQEECQQLAAYGLPETLVHGDLHGGNIAYADDGFVYFDWTDACVTHPFFDMHILYLDENKEVQTELRDAYLAEWTDYATMDKLLEAWEVGEWLTAVHHAISYWQIRENIETRYHREMGGMLPFWLRKLIALAGGDEEGMSGSK